MYKSPEHLIWMRACQARDLAWTIPFEWKSIPNNPLMNPDYHECLSELEIAYFRARDRSHNQDSHLKLLKHVTDFLLVHARYRNDEYPDVIPIAVRIASRLLYDQGWVCVASDEELLTCFGALDLNRLGVAKEVDEIMTSSFEFVGETVGQAFNDVRQWASQFPEWEEQLNLVKEDLKRRPTPPAVQ